MALRFQTLHKPACEQLWRVAIPGVGNSIESAVFHLDGNAWKFKLQTRWAKKQDEEWIMHIRKCDSLIDTKKFWLAAYVGDDTVEYCVAHTEISSENAVIWSYSRQSFLASFPLKVTGILRFTFEFVTLRKVSQSFLDEHKSLHTPSPVVPPSHLDDRPCLDNLSLALRKLLDESSDSDVQLKCGECSIAAHKLILGIRSQVFRTMLRSDMLEKQKGVVEIVDMEPKVFEIFIRYLYTGILPEIAEDIAMSLYEAADMYQVEALKGRCGDCIAGNLTRENALRILAIADGHSDEDLKDKVATHVLNEKIPSNGDEWSGFCEDYPKLAIEVLNRAYNQTSCSH